MTHPVRIVKSQEPNDCTVRALAAVTRKPYAHAYKALEVAGRRPGKVCKKPDWEPVYKAMGLRELVLDGIGQGRRSARLNTVLRTLPPGRYVIRIRRHVLAYVGGVIYDHGMPPNGAVKNVYVYDDPDSSDAQRPVWLVAAQGQAVYGAPKCGTS